MFSDTVKGFVLPRRRRRPQSGSLNADSAIVGASEALRQLLTEDKQELDEGLIRGFLV